MMEYYLETVEAGIITIEAPNLETAYEVANDMGLTILTINEC
jgi:hypothetical protein